MNKLSTQNRIDTAMHAVSKSFSFILNNEFGLLTAMLVVIGVGASIAIIKPSPEDLPEERVPTAQVTVIQEPDSVWIDNNVETNSANIKTLTEQVLELKTSLGFLAESLEQQSPTQPVDVTHPRMEEHIAKAREDVATMRLLNAERKLDIARKRVACQNLIMIRTVNECLTDLLDSMTK